MKYKSLFDIWKQSAEKFNDFIAFTDNKNNLCITYKQALREVCFLASEFSKYGLKKMIMFVCLQLIHQDG